MQVSMYDLSYIVTELEWVNNGDNGVLTGWTEWGIFGRTPTYSRSKRKNTAEASYHPS